MTIPQRQMMRAGTPASVVHGKAACERRARPRSAMPGGLRGTGAGRGRDPLKVSRLRFGFGLMILCAGLIHGAVGLSQGGGVL